MAYACILAAVERQQVEDYQRGQRSRMQASKTVRCSHGIAYWVRAQPFGKLLGEAIDGGERLRDDLWHPLKAPTVHSVEAVQSLHAHLADAWSDTIRNHGKPEEGDWYAAEISPAIDVFVWASSGQMCVVSVLEPPFDEQRAKRVDNPIEGFSW